MLTVCMVIVFLMMIAAVLQVSLISSKEWETLRAHVRNAPRYARSLSYTVGGHVKNMPRYARSLSCAMYERSEQPRQRLIRLISGSGRADASVRSDSSTSVDTTAIAPPDASRPTPENGNKSVKLD